MHKGYDGHNRNRGAERLVIPAVLLAIVLVFISCGNEESKNETSAYDGWSKYSYGHYVINFSPNSAFAADKATLARSFENFLTQISDLLEIEIPDDKIYLFVYGSSQEAKEIAGREAPFSNDSAVHWAGVSPYGYQLAKFILSRRGIKPGRFDVFNEGIAYLLDFSGINYHDRTNRLVNSGKFVPLKELGDNEAFNALPSYINRSQSASLIAFIMYNFGVERLFMLNASLTDWQETIESLFQMEIDIFEESWLEFAREHSDDPEGTLENDPTRTTRIKIGE